jgi:mono/diheme cytochrome c family protein
MLRGFVCAAVVTIAAGAGAGTALSGHARDEGRSAAAVVAPLTVDEENALVARSCAGCHDDDGRPGGLSLEHFDGSKVVDNAETAEKMIRKLRAGMMPPPQVKDRPERATLDAFAASLEAVLDEHAAAHPQPGRRTFQRLNRAEYTRAIHDLLALDVDVNAFLPADTISQGFDNIADAQAFSPTLVTGYLRAASHIVGLALGDREAAPAETTIKLPLTTSQMTHVEGAPWGTRGGISIVHTFPADGDYTFRMLFVASSGLLFGNIVKGEQIEVSVNGERVALLDINPRMSEADKNGVSLVTARIHVAAGPQRVTAAFLQRCDCPNDDLIAPIDYTLADPQIGEHGYGITTLPHVREFTIAGPFTVTGVSDTPSRRKIFSCRPASAHEEAGCARTILKALATAAYREPANGAELEPLMKFFEEGRRQGGFENGIKLGIQAILVSPRFLFRLEEAPTGGRPGEPYRISDVDLASRLSFFLWGGAPDAELLRTAAAGTLHTPAVLELQVRRMLADRKSEALSTRFAAQWLRLQDVDRILPEPVLYPSFDRQLAQSFKRETELFFDSIVREDRNVLDLLTANYTFVNERIARHYGISNVTGDAFRRVTLDGDLASRRGLLGQGSWLMATSVADRTSPVQRGKWIMEVLLGSPPPPPPPNVPALDETKPVASGRTLSTRERMEEHRKNPACASCHRVIDPLGLALENFDVTAAWRIKDAGVPVDAKGVLYDGSAVDGPAGLRTALLGHRETILRNFAGNLMAFALGRRLEYFDQPAVRAVVKRATGNENRFSSYVLGIVNSAAFQMNEAAPVATDAGSAGGTPRR